MFASLPIFLCTFQVEIACESEEGDECRDIPQADDADECLLDVIYTYTVDNTGDVDANVILFTRTREGEFMDLMPLLDSTFIAEGGTTVFTETEEIDRCVSQNFFTETQVVVVPNPDLLCADEAFYP